MKIKTLNRRTFIKNAGISAGLLTLPLSASMADVFKRKKGMKFGLVTYLWAKDWDLDTLLRNCEKTGVAGVELRTQHAHGVEPNLSAAQRNEVKAQFKDSNVVCLGPGTNQEYHNPDPEVLKKQIEGTKEFMKLSHDIGGTGVKVKPNGFNDKMSREKTLEQIGKALNECGKFASDYGQQIRLEVHGRETQELPNIHQIMQYADNPNVTVCWNCNNEDLLGEGLEHNFNLVKSRFGDTVHIRELNEGDYPYQQLFNLFVKNDYQGYICLEARTDPADKVKALLEQRQLLEKMIASAS
jgi:sugar phosphate isomerase/epimerase